MNLNKLLENLSRNGCSRFYAKKLAQNNNNKQQIYLGNGFENRNNAVNLLSYDLQEEGGIICLHGNLDFHWMDDKGSTEKASDAKLIYYQQYPEVRLSGFLRGCRLAPSEYLKWEKGMVFPDRFLVLGLTGGGRTIAYLAVGPSLLYDDLLAYCDDHPTDNKGVLFEIKPSEQEDDAKQILLRKLAQIHQMGWLDSRTLTSTGLETCEGNRCVGLTLEAQFGIVQNAVAGPDFMGWELKSLTLNDFSSQADKRITIIEPQPNGGLYKESIKDFIKKFGHPHGKDPSRLNFNGTFSSQNFNQRKGLKLVLEGFNQQRNKFDPTGKLQLISEKGFVAAEWSFLKLRKHWLKKHQSAAYVPALRNPKPLRYRYGSEVFLGKGTDFIHLLKALANGHVFLDPATWVKNLGNGTVKHRNMFRIKRFDLPELYKESGICDVRKHR
jgi:hypothetical protein